MEVEIESEQGISREYEGQGVPASQFLRLLVPHSTA